MDPEQTLADLLYLLAQGEDDRQNVACTLRDLHDWVRMGGFLPDPKKVASKFVKESFTEADRMEYVDSFFPFGETLTCDAGENREQYVVYTGIDPDNMDSEFDEEDGEDA